MQIRRILLKNLHSIRGEVEIDFTTVPLSESGLFAITGDTGAGKTTILDAITLALYGNICRNSDPRDALSFGADEGYAHCEFEADGRRFLAQWHVRTTRSKKPENRLKEERSVAEWDKDTEEFYIIAERKKREIQTLIEQVTGLDFARFTRSVLLAQGDFAAFLKANPKERSDLLERITGTEIYSELSKAALERKNIEQASLQSLTQQRDALQIFSKEVLREKKKELKAKEKENHSLQKTLGDANRQLQWLEQKITLGNRKQEALKSLEDLELTRENLQQDFHRLELHEKTLPLHPTLTLYRDKESSIAHLRTEISAVTSTITEVEARESEIKKSFEAEKQSLANLKSTQPDAMRLIEEVSRLDIMIDNHRASLSKLQSEQKEWNDKSVQAKTQKSALEERIKELDDNIKNINAWLAENREAAHLAKELPSIQLLRKQLRDHLSGSLEAKKRIAGIDKQLTGADKLTAKLEQDLQKQNGQLEIQLTAFRELTPAGYASDRSELIDKVNREIELLGDQFEHYRQLSSLSEEYRRTLAELTELEDELDNLRKEELALDKDLLNAVEQSDEAESNLSYKREVYRQQMLIANYEKDRASLQPGDPCPVCFSTQHPFRDMEVKPFEDKAKEELTHAEKVLERLTGKRNQLLKRHIEIASQIRQIDSGTNGQLVRVRKRLEDCEKKMAKLIPNLTQEDFSRSHGDWLIKKLTGFDQTLEEKRTVRAKLTNLHTDITRIEADIRKVENELKDSQFEQFQLKENREHQMSLLKSLEDKFEQGTAEINKLIGKYGYRFSVDKAQEIFTDLENRENEFSHQREMRNDLQKQQELAKQSLKQKETSVEEYRRELQRLQKEHTRESEAMKQLTKKRIELFGEKDPGTERDRLIALTEEKESSLLTISEQYDTIKASLTSLRQSHKDSSKRLEMELTAFEKIKEKLQKGSREAGFDDIAGMESSILPESEYRKIQAEKNQLKENEIKLRQTLKATEEELAALEKRPTTDKNQEELRSEIKSLESDMRINQQAIGALRQQLADNDSRKEESIKLLEQIEEQRKTYNRWMALYDLIGSSDGKKFRVYAQGLTLQKLVQLANKHLSNLYGRYVIVKRKGEELELDIVDTYQAENIRSMHTLSGGESFLVSLALALGLSDLAGRKANIKSLFIDEGFGTLDDQTLDLAIRTLENLQASGKTIGIISHVKELKERITTQVRVTKKGGGLSEVTVIG